MRRPKDKLIAGMDLHGNNVVIGVINQDGKSSGSVPQNAIFSNSMARRYAEMRDRPRRQMFELCVSQNWKPNEVAKTLGVSVGRVYLAKHQLSKMLKQEMKRLVSVIERAEKSSTRD